MFASTVISRFRFQLKPLVCQCLQQLLIFHKVAEVATEPESTLAEFCVFYGPWSVVASFFGSSRSLHGLYNCHCLRSNIAEFRLYEGCWSL